MIGQAYYETYGVAVSITRCSNIYGGGDTNLSRLVPGVVRSALRRERPVIRSDGTPLRDYLYVSDAVDAYLLLGENLDRQAVRGQAFNFGTNSPVSVLGLTNRILELSGCSNLKPIVRGESTGEIQKQYLSSAKAKAVLGWAPRVSLDDVLKKTIDWYRSGLGTTPRW